MPRSRPLVGDRGLAIGEWNSRNLDRALRAPDWSLAILHLRYSKRDTLAASEASRYLFVESVSRIDRARNFCLFFAVHRATSGVR